MARKNGFKKVTCGHKANIMKLTDGLFLEVFYEVSRDYPEIEANDVIVDDLAMKLVRAPDQFQVLVLPNLQGDIISDLCAGLVGGLGFAPSANIGDSVAIFEAVHGTAPDIAGKGLANPTSLLMSGLMMLRHFGLMEHATAIEDALYLTLESGIHTSDFGSRDKKACSTKEFAQAIISNIKLPADIAELAADKRGSSNAAERSGHRLLESAKNGGVVVGIDLFVESNNQPPAIAQSVNSLLAHPYKLTLISNRGTQVWPSGSLLTDCVNQYRVRIEVDEGVSVTESDMLRLALKISECMRISSTEMLMKYKDLPAYSLAQGQS
jgi:isocitrate dehydrogenase